MNLANNNSFKQSDTSSLVADQSAESTMFNQPQDISPSSESQASPERQKPIPPPSHPRQYRAIGLVKAKYMQSEEQMTQGTLITTDGAEIEAVLLGRIISLIKNHLDLNKEHLWVVYPRTKTNNDRLHVQIVGVWEPETLNQGIEEELEGEETEHGYFSIRGEVIFYSTEENHVIVKIKQFPRKEGEKPKFFKLKLQGIPGEKPIKRFWDLKVRLEQENLIIESGTDLGFAQKRKPKFKKDPKKIQLKSARISKPSPTARPKPRKIDGGESVS